MTKTICIVGNSPNLKGKGLGSLIDRFDNVCRVNDWVTKDYEKDVGTKTTHWVTGCGRQIPRWSKNRNIADKNVIAIFPKGILNRYARTGRAAYSKRRCHKNWGYSKNGKQIWKTIDGDFFNTVKNVTIVSSSNLDLIQKETVPYYSTGIAAIAYFVFVMGYEVHTIGFDFYQSSSTHYWGKATKRSRRHNFKKEAEIYKRWIDEGKIKLLDKDIDTEFTENFLILGNGPSLRDVDFEMVERNSSKLNIIGINRSYLAYPKHNFMVVQDVEPVVELFDKGYSDAAIAKMNICTSTYFDKRIDVMSKRDSYKPEEIERLRRLRTEDVIKSLGPRAYGPTEPGSLELAMSTSIHKLRSQQFNGTIRFYLVGVDMKHYPGDNHFYGDKVKETCRWPNEGSMPRQVSRSLNSFKHLIRKKVFEKKNVEVITCDEKSALRKFIPYQSLKSVIDEDFAAKNVHSPPPDPNIRITQASSPRASTYIRKITNLRAQRRKRRESAEQRKAKAKEAKLRIETRERRLKARQ